MKIFDAYNFVIDDKAVENKEAKALNILKSSINQLPKDVLLNLKNIKVDDLIKVFENSVKNQPTMFYGIDVTNRHNQDDDTIEHMTPFGNLVFPNELTDIVNRKVSLEECLIEGFESLSKLFDYRTIIQKNYNSKIGCEKSEESFLRIVSGLGEISSKIGMETIIEPSLESISTAIDTIIKSFFKAIQLLIDCINKFINWLKNAISIITRKRNKIISKKKFKENVTFTINKELVKMLTPPDGKDVNIVESIASWTNVLKVLVGDNSGKDAANQIIEKDFSTILKPNCYNPTIKLLIKPPFPDPIVSGIDKSKMLIDYLGPKLSGGYQICCSLPDAEHLDLDNEQDRTKFWQALNISKVGVIKNKNNTCEDKELSLDEGEMRLIVDYYNQLHLVLVDSLNKLEFLEKLSLKLNSKLKEIRDICHGKEFKEEPETRTILFETLVAINYVAKTFKEPLTTVVYNGTELELALSNMIEVFFK